jgi:hypothetical protein
VTPRPVSQALRRHVDLGERAEALLLECALHLLDTFSTASS